MSTQAGLKIAAVFLTRLSAAGGAQVFRPTLADGLVLSSISCMYLELKKARCYVFTMKTEK